MNLFFKVDNVRYKKYIDLYWENKEEFLRLLNNTSESEDSEDSEFSEFFSSAGFDNFQNNIYNQRYSETRLDEHHSFYHAYSIEKRFLRKKGNPFLLTKINNIFKISKVDNNHYIYERNQIKKLAPTNYWYFYQTNLRFKPYYEKNKDTFEKLILGDYKWVSDLRIGSNIVKTSVLRKYNINNINEMYHKLFNYLPKKFFFENLENDRNSLAYAIYLKKSDKFSLDFCKNLKYSLNSVIYDTCKMAIDLKKPFNPKWSNLKWKEKHDEYNKIIIEKQIKERLKNKKIKKLKISQHFRNFDKFFSHTEFYKKYKFELIKTDVDLIKEGIEMQHCVSTYENYVNSGRCVIYKAFFNENVTIEINKNLVISQAMYKKNISLKNSDFFKEYNDIVNDYV